MKKILKRKYRVVKSLLARECKKNKKSDSKKGKLKMGPVSLKIWMTLRDY
jgi:hypothetical protein